MNIAISADFKSASSLSRVCRKMLGVTPSVFRKSPDWQRWHQVLDPHLLPIYQNIEYLKGPCMQNLTRSQSVKIVEFPFTNIAALEHKGSPDKVMASVKNFIEWRKENGPSPSVSDTYNILYDDPCMVAPKNYRFDICASVNSRVLPNDYGVVEKVIPPGRCALLRHIGSDNTLGRSIDYLYSDWLMFSGETLRDFPCFVQRVTFFPDLPEHDMIIDIYLPIN